MKKIVLLVQIVLMSAGIGTFIFASQLEAAVNTPEAFCEQYNEFNKSPDAEASRYVEMITRSGFEISCQDVNAIYFTKNGNPIPFPEFQKELEKMADEFMKNELQKDSLGSFTATVEEKAKSILDSIKITEDNPVSKLLTLSSDEWENMITIIQEKDVSFDGRTCEEVGYSQFHNAYIRPLAQTFNIFYICNPADKSIIFYSIITDKIQTATSLSSDTGSVLIQSYLASKQEFQEIMATLAGLGIKSSIDTLGVYQSQIDTVTIDTPPSTETLNPDIVLTETSGGETNSGAIISQGDSTGVIMDVTTQTDFTGNLDNTGSIQETESIPTIDVQKSVSNGALSNIPDKLLWIIVALIIVVVGACGYYFVIKRQRVSNKSGTSAINSTQANNVGPAVSANPQYQPPVQVDPFVLTPVPEIIEPETPVSIPGGTSPVDPLAIIPVNPTVVGEVPADPLNSLESPIDSQPAPVPITEIPPSEIAPSPEPTLSTPVVTPPTDISTGETPVTSTTGNMLANAVTTAVIHTETPVIIQNIPESPLVSKAILTTPEELLADSIVPSPDPISVSQAEPMIMVQSPGIESPIVPSLDPMQSMEANIPSPSDSPNRESPAN